MKKKSLSPADELIMGPPKSGATHFSVVCEVRPKKWKSQRTAVDKPGILQSVFPLELCSVEWFRERWGPGIYKPTWVHIDPATNIAAVLGPGRRFEVDAPAPAPEVAPTAPAPLPKRKVKVVKRTGLKSQLRVLEQLQAMNRETVKAAVDERMTFIQAEAQRNREHQIELERLRMRHERQTKAEPSAAPTSDDGVTSAVAAGISQIVEKLDAVASAGGDKSDLMRVGEMLAPGFNKIIAIVAKVVEDKLDLAPDEDDPDDPEPEEPEEQEEAQQ